MFRVNRKVLLATTGLAGLLFSLSLSAQTEQSAPGGGHPCGPETSEAQVELTSAQALNAQVDAILAENLPLNSLQSRNARDIEILLDRDRLVAERDELAAQLAQVRALSTDQSAQVTALTLQLEKQRAMISLIEQGDLNSASNDDVLALVLKELREIRQIGDQAAADHREVQVEAVQLADKLEQDLAARDTELAMQTAKLESQIAQLTDLKTTTSSLSEQRDALLALRDQLIERADSAEKSLVALKAQLAEQRSEVERLQGQVTALEAQLDATTARNQTLGADFAALQTSSTKQETELVDLRKLIADLEVQRTDTQARLTSVESDLTAQTGQAKRLETQLLTVRATMVGMRATRTKQAERITALEGERAELTKAQMDSQTRIAALEASVEGLEADLAREQALIVTLKADHSSAIDALTASYKQTSTSSSSDVERLNEERTRLLERIEELTRELTTAGSQTLEQTRALEQLEAQFAIAARENKNLDETLIRTNIEFAAARDELKRLEELLFSRDKQVERLERAISILQRQRAALRDQLASCNAFADRYKQEIDELQQVRDSFNQALASAGDGLMAIDNRETLRFGTDVLFASGSARLKSDGKARLAELSSSINEALAALPDGQDWIVSVEGHADITTIKNSRYRTNRELSFARAQAVSKVLVASSNLNEADVLVAGFGEHRPIDPALTNEAFAKNRRVEMRLLKRSETSTPQADFK